MERSGMMTVAAILFRSLDLKRVGLALGQRPLKLISDCTSGDWYGYPAAMLDGADLEIIRLCE